MSSRPLPRWRATTSARVTVQVEVDVGSWGPDCDLAQVYRQGSESALGRIRNALMRDSGMRVVKITGVEAFSTNMEVTK